MRLEGSGVRGRPRRWKSKRREMQVDREGLITQGGSIGKGTTGDFYHGHLSLGVKVLRYG